MKLIRILCALLLASLGPTAAHAGEFFGGLHVHDVRTPLDKSGIEDGVDFSLGFRAGGLFGTVTAVEGDEVRVEIADGVEVRLAKRAVAGVVSEDEEPEEEPEEETTATLPPDST